MGIWYDLSDILDIKTIVNHVLGNNLLDGEAFDNGDVDDENKRQHLDKIANESNGDIKYFEADLLEPGSYKEAMEDCELVFHTASPFFLDSKDAQ